MLPKHLFRVAKTGGKNLSYAERGGGTFASLNTAQDRKAALLRRHPEATIKIFVTECDWIEIDNGL